MRKLEFIKMSTIMIDHLPLNPTGLATTVAMMEGVKMPPIKVVQLEDGRNKIKDGRHRYLAHKLLGKETIWAKVSKKE
jgi:uncharacterized ParB-like nuclease family protein